MMGGAENYDDLHPVYETVPGWTESTVGAQRVEDLPPLLETTLRSSSNWWVRPLTLSRPGLIVQKRSC